MFKTASVTEPAPVDVDPVNLTIPLSVLELDLSAPVGGWEPFLTVRNIAVVADDVGRKSVSRDDARTLIAEQHENERRAQEVAERQERQFIEADKAWRSQLPPGVSWLDMTPGVAPAAAMLAADADSQVSVREQLLQQELAHLSNGNES